VLETPAATEDINEFIQWRIDEYGKCRHTGSVLSALYGEEFKNFTEDTFRQAYPLKRTDLQAILQDKGVYISVERNADTSKALVAAA
jgi:hypothetical protein